MSPFLQLAFLLAVILLTAKLAGYAALRLHQPSVLGEMLVGILLGPSLINIYHLPILDNESTGEIIKSLGEVGVLLLMFIAGLELHISELRQNTRASALAGTLGAVLSFGLGWGAGVLFGMSGASSAFLGLTLAASSVSISAQTLMELNQLKSRVGLSLLGAAVFDDVLVILMLSVFFAFTSDAHSFTNLLWIFARMLIFFALAAGFGLWLLPRLIKAVRNLPISQNILTFAIVILLTYAIAAELIGGMATITGAFVAGLMFARSPEKESLEPRIHALAYGFFVPIFFVSIGLTANIFALRENPALGFIVIVVAIVGKVGGAGLGARLARLTSRESLQLGMGMVPRAEVSLIAASVGLQAGLLDAQAFSAIVGMVIVCTLITPPVLRYMFHKI
jgi:Kef-type K+ transport system membrane component KefB